MDRRAFLTAFGINVSCHVHPRVMTERLVGPLKGAPPVSDKGLRQVTNATPLLVGNAVITQSRRLPELEHGPRGLELQGARTGLNTYGAIPGREIRRVDGDDMFNPFR